jgi:hypothetical protein
MGSRLPGLGDEPNRRFRPWFFWRFRDQIGWLGPPHRQRIGDKNWHGRSEVLDEQTIVGRVDAKVGVCRAGPVSAFHRLTHSPDCK